MIKMPRCRRGKNVVGLREGGVHHKHDPRGARLQPSLPALLSGNLDSGHSGVFFFGLASALNLNFNLFQAPCVFHAGPALFGLAIERARLELTARQCNARCLIQARKAGAFFYL